MIPQPADFAQATAGVLHQDEEDPRLFPAEGVFEFRLVGRDFESVSVFARFHGPQTGGHAFRVAVLAAVAYPGSSGHRIPGHLSDGGSCAHGRVRSGEMPGRRADLRRVRHFSKHWGNFPSAPRTPENRPPRLLRRRRDPLGFLSSGRNLWEKFYFGRLLNSTGRRTPGFRIRLRECSHRLPDGLRRHEVLEISAVLYYITLEMSISFFKKFSGTGDLPCPRGRGTPDSSRLISIYRGERA